MASIQWLRKTATFSEQCIYFSALENNSKDFSLCWSIILGIGSLEIHFYSATNFQQKYISCKKNENGYEHIIIIWPYTSLHFIHIENKKKI